MVTEVSAITAAPSTVAQLGSKLGQGAASIVALIAAHKLESIATGVVLAGTIGSVILWKMSGNAEKTASESKEAGEAAKALIKAAVDAGLIKVKDDSYELGATADVKTLRNALVGKYDATVAAAAVKAEIGKYKPLTADQKTADEAIVAVAGKEIDKTEDAVKAAKDATVDGSLAKVLADNGAKSGVAVDELTAALANLKHDDEKTFKALTDAVKPFQTALDNNQEQKVVDALGKITDAQIGARAAAELTPEQKTFAAELAKLDGVKKFADDAAKAAFVKAADAVKGRYSEFDKAVVTLKAVNVGEEKEVEFKAVVEQLVWVQGAEGAFAKLFTEGDTKMEVAAVQTAIVAAFGSTDSLEAKITGTTAGGQAGEVRAAYNAILAKLDVSEKIEAARTKGLEIRAAVAEVASKLVAKDDTKKADIEAFVTAIEGAKATIADASTAKEVRKLSEAFFDLGAKAIAQAKDEAKFDLKIGDKEEKDKKASEHLLGIVQAAVAQHKTDFPGTKFDEVKEVLIAQFKAIDTASKAAETVDTSKAGYGTLAIAGPVALALTLAILAIGMKYAGDKVLPPNVWAKISWIRNF